ncbi:MAG: PH domain-containing protein [Acidimicrobiales bacterium]
MAFPTKLLNHNEEIILDLRPHWWRIVPASAALAVAVLFGIFAWASWDNGAVNVLAGLLIIAALVYFVRSYVMWVSENFVVTSERVIHRFGVFAKSGIEIPLDRINTVFFRQSVFERMLGAGNLGVESAGEGGQQTFKAVRKPNLVQQEIYRAMEAAETRNFKRMGQATASAIGGGSEPAADSIPEQIKQLDELRKAGSISAEEYESKKRELLDRM